MRDRDGVPNAQDRLISDQHQPVVESIDPDSICSVEDDAERQEVLSTTAEKWVERKVLRHFNHVRHGARNVDHIGRLRSSDLSKQKHSMM